jgi:hypothetical protein
MVKIQLDIPKWLKILEAPLLGFIAESAIIIVWVMGWTVIGYYTGGLDHLKEVDLSNREYIFANVGIAVTILVQIIFMIIKLWYHECYDFGGEYIIRMRLINITYHIFRWILFYSILISDNSLAWQFAISIDIFIISGTAILLCLGYSGIMCVSRIRSEISDLNV